MMVVDRPDGERLHSIHSLQAGFDIALDPAKLVPRYSTVVVNDDMTDGRGTSAQSRLG